MREFLQGIVVKFIVNGSRSLLSCRSIAEVEVLARAYLWDMGKAEQELMANAGQVCIRPSYS